MRWFSALGTLLLATALNGLPAFPDPNAEMIPKAIEDATPSTELQPPRNNADGGARKRQKIYLINIYSLTTDGSDESLESLESGEVDEEILVTDIVERIPEILDPVASVLLLVEAGAEDIPVDMDVIAKDLEAKGYPVNKFVKDGETRVILIDLVPADSQDDSQDDSHVDSDDDEDRSDHAPKEDHAVDLIKPIETNIIKVRRKRAPCVKCYVDNVLPASGGYRGNGYGGQYGYPEYGRGGYPQGGGNVAVIVVPVESGGGRQYPSGGGHRQYPSGGGGQYPSGGGGGRGYRPCNGCQVQGGGGSWSTSSAQASSQSASGNW